MPRLRYIEESEKTPLTSALIELAKRTGALIQSLVETADLKERLACNAFRRAAE